MRTVNRFSVDGGSLVFIFIVFMAPHHLPLNGFIPPTTLRELFNPSRLGDHPLPSSNQGSWIVHQPHGLIGFGIPQLL